MLWSMRTDCLVFFVINPPRGRRPRPALNLHSPGYQTRQRWVLLVMSQVNQFELKRLQRKWQLMKIQQQPIGELQRQLRRQHHTKIC